MKKDTSWGNVAEWYADHVLGEDSYHKQVVLPNLLRLMHIEKGMHVLDVACGSGFFAHEFFKAGAVVQGIDLGAELIAIAQKHYGKDIDFKVAPAHKFSHVHDASVDVITIILAIQNIGEVKETLAECSRVLKPQGKVYIVMNHPAFRIPGGSSWGFDPPSPKAMEGQSEQQKMYRRIDEYLSEKKVPITMHPGTNPKEKTVSFHRPLQYYMKLIGNGGFAATRLEEWISHKKSEPGPRQLEEYRTRKEIPLFMTIELVKHSV
jgi:ubiquinone/menaquinone biosynthesis C-methylase UbiE